MEQQSISAAIFSFWRSFFTHGVQSYSGIGRESCLLFTKEGANVVCADLNLATAEETAKLCNAQNAGKAIAIKVDVSKEDEVKASVELAEKEFGKLNVIFSTMLALCTPMTTMLKLPRRRSGISP